MSLVRTFARLAPQLMQLAPLTVTFTRTTPGAYDAVSGVTMPPTVTTWRASAVVVGNDQAGTRSSASQAPTGQRRTLRTLLVAGLGITAPLPGDRVVAGGLTLRVVDVTATGALDGDVVPLYRVECDA